MGGRGQRTGAIYTPKAVAWGLAEGSQRELVALISSRKDMVGKAWRRALTQAVMANNRQPVRQKCIAGLCNLALTRMQYFLSPAALLALGHVCWRDRQLWHASVRPCKPTCVTPSPTC